MQHALMRTWEDWLAEETAAGRGLENEEAERLPIDVRHYEAAGTIDGALSQDANAAHVQVWGSGLRLQTLLGRAPSPDERWSGEPTRFGELALRLWSPLLSHEQLLAL